MARFTENQKLQLRTTVLEKTFSGRKEAIAAMRQDLAERVYASQGKDRVDLLASLPDGVVRESADIKCYFGGQSTTLTLATERPQAHRAYEDRLRFSTDDVLTRRFEEINLIQAAITKEHDLLRTQIWSLLSTVNTDKQLFAVWPEAREFIPEGETKNLPAPLTADLNKMIRDFSAGGAQ